MTDGSIERGTDTRGKTKEDLTGFKTQKGSIDGFNSQKISRNESIAAKL